ncbi:hypothetical protein PVK06_039936 [Gossypium arboreum]|uniref:Uncharacterized protein n=1 Tax=Gossypium arboreum TaxID=29729 RepID=A0ABR0N457_GOSAR|nr:hypothetical protein PVK06_039936 [Gossypium arboreum]
MLRLSLRLRIVTPEEIHTMISILLGVQDETKQTSSLKPITVTNEKIRESIHMREDTHPRGNACEEMIVFRTRIFHTFSNKILILILLCYLPLVVRSKNHVKMKKRVKEKKELERENKIEKESERKEKELEQENKIEKEIESGVSL